MKLALIALLAASGAMADTVTLEMDEVPNQPIDGLAVTKGGESFTFSDPGGNYQYNFVVPGTQDYLTNPGLAGHLPETLNMVAYAGACRAVTSSIPASRAYILASAVASAIANEL